jgi:hypothetical protein
MQFVAVTLAMFVAVVLIHFSYVDFRFRYRGGITWFWLLRPAPPLVWLSRAALVGALLLALATPLLGTGKSFILVSLFVIVHITCLIVAELREPR